MLRGRTVGVGVSPGFARDASLVAGVGVAVGALVELSDLVGVGVTLASAAALLPGSGRTANASVSAPMPTIWHVSRASLLIKLFITC